MFSTKKEKGLNRSFLELSIISVSAWFAPRFHFRRKGSLKIQNNSLLNLEDSKTNYY
jgi:hypothetical protein